MSDNALPSRRFASVSRAAASNGVDPSTVYNYIRRGDIPAYRLPGKRGHFVDVDEAAKVLGPIARSEYGKFGPDAVIRDLSKVVGADFEVVD